MEGVGAVVPQPHVQERAAVGAGQGEGARGRARAVGERDSSGGSKFKPRPRKRRICPTKEKLGGISTSEARQLPNGPTIWTLRCSECLAPHPTPDNLLWDGSTEDLLSQLRCAWVGAVGDLWLPE